MAVRFLPPPDQDATPSAASDRADLAEVIDLRSRLVTSSLERTSETERRSGRERRSETEQASAAQAPEEIRTLSGAVPSESALSAAVSAAETISADDLSSEAVRSSASEDGVRLLARKARSSGELRRELLHLAHDPHEVDETILEFESSLYLDDLGLARVVSEGLRERKRASRMQIRMKLRDRLLPEGVIEQVLAELDDDAEEELLNAAARERARRLTGLDRQTAERRLLGFLARRGWSGERATRVAREALNETGDGSRGPGGRAGGVRFR